MNEKEERVGSHSKQRECIQIRLNKMVAIWKPNGVRAKVKILKLFKSVKETLENKKAFLFLAHL
jgi:hypothetical protein